MNYATLIDPTRFRTVREHLARARSPITEVLLVADEDLLPHVATLLDAESGVRPDVRRWYWDSLRQRGKVRPGQRSPGDGGVNLETVPDDAHCQVLFFPPLYLVHVPGLDLNDELQPAG